MSWKPEVIADGSGQWTGNGLNFATKGEALVYGSDLMGRWTSVQKYRAVESELPVNYQYANGKLTEVKV